MANVLVINSTPQEVRVALLEDGSIADYYVERRRNESVVGNIYNGRVARVLPGMQASFVEIGLDKAAFLYVDDVYNQHTLIDEEIDDEDDEDDDDNGGSSRKRDKSRPIEAKLNEGQSVLVQVVKDPIGTKGARITSHVTVAGRHLVFMPTSDRVGISRQITSDKERKRLRDIAKDIKPREGGFIVRTAGEGASRDELQEDLKAMIQLWNDLLQQSEKKKAPALLHEDVDLVLRAVRDLASDDIDRIVIDSRDDYDRIAAFVERHMPEFLGRVELFVGSEPVFDAYGIETELDRALQQKVGLPSGGHLVIDQTEAMTVIDVNTGKFVGKKSLEETIVKTNLEAVEEVVYQLRLRSIGGLIVVDFIDMDDASNRDKVFQKLQASLKGDKGRAKVLRISEFGLVEMTRKRTRENLVQMLCEGCDHCDGRGYVKSSVTVAFEILRKLRRDLGELDASSVELRANRKVIDELESHERESLRNLEMRFNKKLHLRGVGSYHVERFDIRPRQGRASGKGGGGRSGGSDKSGDGKSDDGDSIAS